MQLSKSNKRLGTRYPLAQVALTQKKRVERLELHPDLSQGLHESAQSLHSVIAFHDDALDLSDVVEHGGHTTASACFGIAYAPCESATLNLLQILNQRIKSVMHLIHQVKHKVFSRLVRLRHIDDPRLPLGVLLEPS